MEINVPYVLIFCLFLFFPIFFLHPPSASLLEFGAMRDSRSIDHPPTASHSSTSLSASVNLDQILVNHYITYGIYGFAK